MIDKEEAAKKCGSGLKSAYSYEEGRRMKEVEHGVASNIEKVLR